MTRRPSLAGLLAKRYAEDEKLRAAVVEMKAKRDALDARIREAEAVLGATSRAAVRERPKQAKCRDCGAFVIVPDNAGERGSQCPACECSPFEYSPDTVQ